MRAVDVLKSAGFEELEPAFIFDNNLESKDYFYVTDEDGETTYFKSKVSLSNGDKSI